MLNMFKSFLSPSLPTRAEGLVYGNSTVFHFANRPETQGTGWQSQYCFAVWIRIKHDQTWLLQRGQCGCPQLPYPNGVRVKTQCQRTDHRLLGWSKKDVADGRSIPRVSEIFPLYISVYIYIISFISQHIPAYQTPNPCPSGPVFVASLKRTRGPDHRRRSLSQWRRAILDPGSAEYASGQGRLSTRAKSLGHRKFGSRNWER
jgi:hypothetical protein